MLALLAGKTFHPSTPPPIQTYMLMTCGGGGWSLKSRLLPPTTFMEYLLYLKANYEEMLKQRGKKSVFSYTLSSFLSPPVFYDERIASVKKVL